jgi:hypothetical protein
VYNNPLKYTDPSGNTAQDSWGEGNDWSFAGVLTLAGAVYTADWLWNDVGVGNFLDRNWIEVRDWAGGILSDIGDFFSGGDGPQVTEYVNPYNPNVDPLAGSSASVAQSSFSGASTNTEGLGIMDSLIFKGVMLQLGSKHATEAFFSDTVGGAADFISAFSMIKLRPELWQQEMSDMVNGLANTALMMTPDESGQTGFENMTTAYVQNIPNMTAYEVGYDGTYAAWTVGSMVAPELGGVALASSSIRGAFNSSRMFRFKPLRYKGGVKNGWTFSRGEGYGARPRLDFHKLGNPSKASNEMTIPLFLKDKKLLHYHRGKGNNLQRHRPRYWDRF